MTPQYEHDCDECQFLGPYEGMDLYYCPQDGAGETLVCRYGDDGPEYSSAPPEVTARWLGSKFEGHQALCMALRRAMEIGLIAREE